MSLSNIIVEPRREITETLVGVAAATPVVYGAYWEGSWIAAYIGDGFPLLFGMVLAIVSWGVLALVLALVHEVGETIADHLQHSHDIRIRPRIRYGSNGGSWKER